eukprot:TRINITY_DN2144_c1_g1_i6.p1 TRINITY_DN2144_c1_g1~~TRINITY_DN2144_c1_g1_i6.p1  ORF type:complete len:206 (+),score=50.99 TRINITY_DN2144_c1_g1_i6:110-727(+)
MSIVKVTEVKVLDNPCAFTDPFRLEISYESLTSLQDDLEWKLIYVGSAEDSKYDQLLDSVFVGPVSAGCYKFIFEVDPPDAKKIPVDDLIGVTVVLLTCSYREQEFIRVGYYVSNDYADEELRENPPEKITIEKIQRDLLAEQPRVTKFPIQWDAPSSSALESSNGNGHGILTTALTSVAEEEGAARTTSITVAAAAAAAAAAGQ